MTMRDRSERASSSRLVMQVMVAMVLLGALLPSILSAGAAGNAATSAVPSTIVWNWGDPPPNGPVAVANDSTVVWGQTLNTTGKYPLDARSPWMVNGSYRGPATLRFVWTFNDSISHTLLGYKVDYAWKYAGVFPVLLTVTDYVTNVTANKTITVTVIPKASGGPDRIVMEKSNKTLITFNASGSRDDKGIVNYTWRFNYSGVEYLRYTPVWTFNFTKPGFYPITLTVTDGIGLTASDTLNVTVKRLPTFYEKHWILVFIETPLIAIAVIWLVFKLKRDKALITPTDVEKLKLQAKNMRKTWKIFRSNRLGFGGLIALIIFAGMAASSPFISTVPHPNSTDNFEPTNLTAKWVNPLPPSFTPSPYTGFVHPFGTDAHGQDVYSLTMYGARASLEVGLVATMISVLMGTLVGLTAGYFGRIPDEVLMRTTDFFLVLPWFPLMIVMMAILGKEFIWVILVIGITSWPSTARVVRAQVLTVKERQFIVRARAVGAGDGHIIKTHIMPNVLPIIFANTVLLIANAIFSESFLDFFGLGDPTIISWGGMLEGAYDQSAFIRGAWWWIAAPGAAIVLMVLAFSMVGYAIDDVLNPKLRRR